MEYSKEDLLPKSKFGREDMGEHNRESKNLEENAILG